MFVLIDIYDFYIYIDKKVNDFATFKNNGNCESGYELTCEQLLLQLCFSWRMGGVSLKAR